MRAAIPPAQTNPEGIDFEVPLTSTLTVEEPPNQQPTQSSSPDTPFRSFRRIYGLQKRNQMLEGASIGSRSLGFASQHTEISYHTSDDGSDFVCASSDDNSSNYKLYRTASRQSLNSLSTTFTLGELGSIEDVSDLECDVVEYEVDDISVEEEKETAKQENCSDVERLRETFCHSKRVQVSALHVSPSMGGLEEVLEEQEQATPGLSDLDENPLKQFESKRLHSSLVFGPGIKEVHHHQSNSRLHNSLSYNLDPDVHPELDLAKARDFLLQLALENHNDDGEHHQQKLNMGFALSRQSTVSSAEFTEILVLSDEEGEDSNPSTNSKHHLSMNQNKVPFYDYTEEILVEDEYEEEEVMEETEQEETIIEEEFFEEVIKEEGT